MDFQTAYFALAKAVTCIIEDVELGLWGEDGFFLYADFRTKRFFSDEVLPLVKEKMKEGYSITYRTMMKQNAAELFKHKKQPFLASKIAMDARNLVEIADIDGLFVPAIDVQVNHIEENFWHLVDCEKRSDGWIRVRACQGTASDWKKNQRKLPEFDLQSDGYLDKEKKLTGKGGLKLLRNKRFLEDLLVEEGFFPEVNSQGFTWRGKELLFAGDSKSARAAFQKVGGDKIVVLSRPAWSKIPKREWEEGSAKLTQGLEGVDEVLFPSFYPFCESAWSQLLDKELAQDPRPSVYWLSVDSLGRCKPRAKLTLGDKEWQGSFYVFPIGSFFEHKP